MQKLELKLLDNRCGPKLVICEYQSLLGASCRKSKTGTSGQCSASQALREVWRVQPPLAKILDIQRVLIVACEIGLSAPLFEG